MNKDKYQESLNDIIKNCKGFPCKNDSFFNMQELIDNSYLEYLGLQDKINDLQSKIDRANEILEKYGLVDKNGNFNAYLDTIELKELKDILKEN